MLTLNLRTFFRDKGIDKPVSWLRKRGVPPHIANKMVNGKYKKSVPMHHINTICEQLWCTPNDLFIWQADNKATDQPTHPLQKMKSSTSTANLNDLITKLTPDKIKELKKIAEGMKGNGV